MPFSFSNESSSHLVLPHRYSMTARPGQCHTAGCRSISLTGIDGRPLQGFELASSCREYLTLNRREKREFFSRRGWRRNLSLRDPSHRKDSTRRSLDGAETRDGAPTSSLFVVVVVVTPAPLLRLARSPGLLVVREESGIDPAVCAGAATSPTHQPRGC